MADVALVMFKIPAQLWQMQSMPVWTPLVSGLLLKCNAIPIDGELLVLNMCCNWSALCTWHFLFGMVVNSIVRAGSEISTLCSVHPS